jgi:hypothetical protein
MHKQKGVALGSLISWCIVAIMVLLFLMAIIPPYMEYRSIMGAADDIVANSSSYSSIAAMRQAFDKQAQIDDITTLKGSDLEIGREGANIVISFEYEKRIKLAGNVGLVITYKRHRR